MAGESFFQHLCQEAPNWRETVAEVNPKDLVMEWSETNQEQKQQSYVPKTSDLPYGGGILKYDRLL